MIYTPKITTIQEIRDETPDTRTLKLFFSEQEERNGFNFVAGQFGLFSAFGAGESAFCIASPPTKKEYIECTFRKVGKVTQAFYSMEIGDKIGFRGPYGNGFPLEQMKGKDVLLVAGGIGITPVRCLLWTILDQRREFGKITLLYGARTIPDLVYKEELKEWERREDMELVRTVDPGGEDPSWDGRIGFVPTVLGEMAPSPENTIVVTCGPPIMIKFVLETLDKLRFSPHQIITTLENRMKCGIGKCGRCNVGGIYVCKEGPVFTAAQIKEFPPDM